MPMQSRKAAVALCRECLLVLSTKLSSLSNNYHKCYVLDVTIQRMGFGPKILGWTIAPVHHWSRSTKHVACIGCIAHLCLRSFSSGCLLACLALISPIPCVYICISLQDGMAQLLLRPLPFSSTVSPPLYLHSRTITERLTYLNLHSGFYESRR